MTYPNNHLYLTFHWLAAGTAEQGQFGLRFDNVAPASQALVDGAAAAANTMWGATTTDISQFFRLAYLRLASIAPNGLYVPGTVAYDHTFPGSVPGGGAAAYLFPLQSAHVVTLHTAMPRGQAHAGRVYLPPITENLTSAAVWTPAQCTSRNNTFATMVTALNTAMGGPASVFSKGTKAAPTVGAKNAITNVNSDTRPDVQRRRAAQQVATFGLPANV
ncbi:MAG TPA: hypothetical protein VN663_03125 [Ramlibacter sp.]|nr:hypothetical protein [Ramlibacter sp.]